MYNENKQLIGFYEVNAGKSQQVIAEEYDYCDIESAIVTCLFTNYTGRLSGSSKDVPIGYNGSPAIQWKYKMNVDNKGKYKAISVFENINGCFVFREHVNF